MLKIGLYVIGDEILSGRRQDKHLQKTIEILAQRGLELAWANYLGDERTDLVAAYQRSLASGDVVFSCGGIGGTPDDHTRQAVAQALGCDLVLHPEAASLIRQRCQETGAEVTPERLRMGEFPVGASIIPNPYNRIPGFNVARHYFLPGFPVMAWPMMEWVLDQFYAAHFHQHNKEVKSVLVYGVMEATLTPLMETIERDYPGLKVFSLPSVGEDGGRKHIDLGVKGPQALVAPGFSALCQGVQALGGVIESTPSTS
jgi:molybdopterin-biosynthesis enzyme MoeA-like protein